MADDASPETKAVYDYFKNAIRNIQSNQQSGLILPSAYDPETRQPLFSFELVSTDGKKNYDISKIKDYYKALIFTSMQADVLLLGQGNTGSFALATVKGTLTAQAAEGMIKNILRTINTDLVRQTYELNGWDVSRMATLDYEGLVDVDVETISKAFQRLGAVGYLPKTADVINKGLETLGIDRLPDTMTQEEIEELLPEKTTKSGEGLKEGMPSGTGQAIGDSGDSSASNSENAA